MGVAHHSHYLAWFEVGRTDLMRNLGCAYREMEAEGCFLPVVEVSSRFHSAVRYDEVLEVETILLQVAASRVTFEYRLRRESEETVLAEGKTVHATVNGAGRVIRLPDSYRKILTKS